MPRGAPTVWACAVGADGRLAAPRAFAELFRGDGRYGSDLEKKVDSLPEGMVTDREGHLYVGTRFGMQVFDETGQLLGLIDFPVPISFSPKRPRSCAFGGEGLSTLYVSCDDEIFAVKTGVGGFVHPEGESE